MYRLTDEQTALIERLRPIADESIAPHAADVDANGRFPREALDALAKGGFLGLTVPKEDGGLGQNMRMVAAVLDEIGQRDASAAMVYLMHLSGTAVYTAYPDSPSDVRRAIASGDHLTTLAFSERGSRSHFWAPVSQAVATNGHVTLSAQKSWVTAAGYADSYVVSTRTAGATAPTDSMLYLIYKDEPGFSVSGPWNSMGMRGNSSAPMQLQDVAVAADRALSAPSGGFTTMLGVVLPLFSIGNAAISIGIAEAAIKATTQHLTGSRMEHLGSRLADLPNLRARLAQMRIETDKARAHLVAVIDAMERADPATQLYVLEIKASASDAAMKVTDLGMQACGGAAFSRHLSIERNFRDARAASVMAPTSDILHDFIGRALCGMELF